MGSSKEQSLVWYPTLPAKPKTLLASAPADPRATQKHHTGLTPQTHTHKQGDAQVSASCNEAAGVCRLCHHRHDTGCYGEEHSTGPTSNLLLVKHALTSWWHHQH